ncbi:MAG: hypothetical protein K2N05_04745 [Muribaculaceae bacterium]|nr:hypothetical protein [Muribaculaceae bacterium]
MRHFLLFLIILFPALSGKAQTAATDAAVANALEILSEKGYSTDVAGGKINAYIPDKEYYEIFINKDGNIPIFQIRTLLGSFSYPNNDPYDVYVFADNLNQNMPFVKFTVNPVQAGGLALIDDSYAEDEIIEYSVSGMVTTFFGTNDQMGMILTDCLNTFRTIKENMPKTLEGFN